jgi:hypothetical protein
MNVIVEVPRRFKLRVSFYNVWRWRKQKDLRCGWGDDGRCCWGIVAAAAMQVSGSEVLRCRGAEASYSCGLWTP